MVNLGIGRTEDGKDDYSSEGSLNEDGTQHEEGRLTKKLESVTTKIPSGGFLSLALGAIGISALLQAFGKKEDSHFVGQWVPTILIMGLYNKLVKLHGSEGTQSE